MWQPEVTHAPSRAPGTAYARPITPTELLHLRDAYLTSFTARVVAADEGRVALDRTAFYPTGGGQPHDTGLLAGWRVTEVRKGEGGVVWHTLEGGGIGFPAGVEVEGQVDWERRFALMRTHTALHVLCGVVWNDHGVAVTGGDMQPLSARMDFELRQVPEGFAATVERRVNEEIAAARPVEVSFVPRSEAVLDEALIRTKANLVPDDVAEVRVVDIVGLDKQADGGTHVANTSQVGTVRVVKTESKGKGFRRIRIEVVDA